eukprot:4164296-Alexandrium_andersonii.AAC.1
MPAPGGSPGSTGRGRSPVCRPPDPFSAWWLVHLSMGRRIAAMSLDWRHRAPRSVPRRLPPPPPG